MEHSCKKVRSKSTEHDQRRVCALVGEPALFFRAPLPKHEKTERQAQRMQKTYVLDANVLLQAPYALESFEDNNIVLPLAVLEELDALKGADGEAGNNARQALRFLEDLRLRGDLVKGVTLPVEAPCAWRSTMWTRPSPRG